MNEEKWYNPNRLLSHNAFINFVMSPRGNGKTYSSKKLLIKNWLKNKSETVYIRRTKVEIEKIKDNFWKDISNEFPNLEFKIEGFTGLINDEIVVHFIPLSTSSNIKSNALPNVNLMIFDEYIITKTTYNRYLKNEMTLFLDLIETVFRNRTNNKVLIMANNVSNVNPFFSFFDIVPNKENRFKKYKNGLICLECYTSDNFIKEKKDTPFGKLIEGTIYSQYAIEGDVLEDTNDFIVPRGTGKYKFICVFKHEDFKVGIWENEKGFLFCDEKFENDNINKFCMRYDEQEEGFIYYKGYREVSSKMEIVKRASVLGNIYFASQEIKKVMQDRILIYL